MTITMIYLIMLSIASISDAHYRNHGSRGHPYQRCYSRGKVIACPYRPGSNGHVSTTGKPQKWRTWRSHRTPYRTTTTTQEPESVESKRIREMYEAARNVSSRNIFGFTTEDADKFTSRIFDEIVRPLGMCQRKFPKFTDCKVQELAHILKENPCTFNMTMNTTQQQSKRRKRRETTMRNADGSVTTIQSCRARGSKTPNGNLNLCAACEARTTLPENFYPRYINEVTCNDRVCFSTNGQCVEKTITLTFRRDDRNVGLKRLHEWVEYGQVIRSECACQIFADSPVSFFV